jgi:phosphoglycolate phosphatase-like HAD superfamily hydrolase
MQAAQAMDVITVGVLTGFSTPEALKPFCTHILDSIADIGTLL